jgi:hypothetical protein
VDGGWVLGDRERGLGSRKVEREKGREEETWWRGGGVVGGEANEVRGEERVGCLTA